MKRKDKDVEGLWAEVKRLMLEMARLQQQLDEQTDCVIVHRGSALACSDAMRIAYYDERRRAERLREELDQLRQDSARYRWLKTQMRATSVDMNGKHTWTLGWPLPRALNVDDACDAGIAHEQGD